MGLFTKKSMKSEEFESLSKRLTLLESEIKILSSSVDAIKTNQNSLRGMVNRKLNPEKEDTEQEPKTEEGKELNNRRYY